MKFGYKLKTLKMAVRQTDSVANSFWLNSYQGFGKPFKVYNTIRQLVNVALEGIKMTS